MSDNKSTASSKGIGFAGLLTIAFIILKLVGVISWKWIWVLSPLWIDLAIVLVVLFILFIVFAFKS